MVDLLIHDEGTVVGFQPVSDAGQQWVAENLVAESWQWIGPVLWVDHRLAPNVLHGADAVGLVCCPERRRARRTFWR